MSSTHYSDKHSNATLLEIGRMHAIILRDVWSFGIMMVLPKQ
jgi:hypothetical protein